MPYPNSPFDEIFDASLIHKLETESEIRETDESPHSSSTKDSKNAYMLQWLCTTPKITSIRVNTLHSESIELLDLLKEHLKTVSKNASIINVCIHEHMNDVIIVEHSPIVLPKIHPKEVIIDSDCGAAVLRGAHIFAPGVLGMLSGCQKGDFISIYVDITKKCKKGFQKVFEEPKVCIGNGITRMVRSELFGQNLNTRGVAVEVIETISGCPQISENIFPLGAALLQNLPSIVCIYSLDPQPGDVILDMCAAPGHKTSHIAALTRNKGTLVAIDKTPGKIKQLTEHCKRFDATAHIFLYDSSLIYQESSNHKPDDGPPFSGELFNKILLDAPCSALGKRPQFRNTITNNVLKSYVPLQKKLFSTAVKLLRPNGILVYSTCTITLGENEGIVAWALRKFTNLRLVRSKMHFGSAGMKGARLSEEQLKLLQRFGPDNRIDSIGFFIACFTKL